MRTRLSAFCDQLIEAGWLLSLIVVPLFFNIFSNRVFEPDKLTALRTITTLMALAWCVKQGEQLKLGRDEGERVDWRAWLRQPLVLPILATIVVYIVATACSIAPATSLWGGYQRLQGAYTTLSYIVLCALMAQGLRSGAQLRRLVSVVICTSLPIALYGLVQHFGLDAMPWGGDVTKRVTSNMGNAIFVAAYLVMVIPLTLARWVELQRHTVERQPKGAQVLLILSAWLLMAAQIAGWFALSFGQGIAIALLSGLVMVGLALYLRAPVGRAVLLGVYPLVLGTQVSALLFTQSRGPLLGVLVAVALFAVLFMTVRAHHKVALVLTVAALVGLVLLVLANLAGSPLAAVRGIPYLGRLGRVLELESGSGKVRVLIWQGSVELIASDPARALVGYGPEAMYVAYNPFYPPELAHVEARNASPDRAHNETFDALVMTGVLGLGALVWLFGSAFVWGVRFLGLADGPGRQRNLIVCLATGGVLGALLPRLLDGSWRLAGVAMPLGMVGGLFAYLMAVAVARALRGAPPLPIMAASPWQQILLMALLAALVGHLVEINVGIAIAATRTYFWAYAALLIVIGRAWVTPEPTAAAATPVAARPALAGKSSAALAARGPRPAGDRSKSHRATPTRTATPPAASSPSALGEILVLALLAGFVLVTMAWDYTTNPSVLRNPFDVIMGTLVSTRNATGAPNPAMLILTLVTAGALVLALPAEYADEITERRDITWWLPALALMAGVSGGIGIIYGLVHASKLLPGRNTPGLINEYYALMALTAVALGIALYRRGPRPSVTVRGWMAVLYAVALVATVLFVGQVNVRAVRADVVYKQGLKYDGDRNWSEAIHYYAEALDLAPNEDYYTLFLGRAQLEKAKAQAAGPARESAFAEAMATLELALRQNPLNPDHTANLARSYRSWAELTEDPALQVQRLERSLAYYQQALRLSPHSALLYNEWGLVHLLAKQYDLALERFGQSLRLDASYSQTYLLIGDTYFTQAAWEQAIDPYQRAIPLDKDMRSQVYAWSRIAYAQSQLGHTQQALDANLGAIALAPEDLVTLRNLAYLYDQLGQPAQGIPYAERALAVAGDKDKPVLQELLQQLKARSATKE